MLTTSGFPFYTVLAAVIAVTVPGVLIYRAGNRKRQAEAEGHPRHEDIRDTADAPERAALQQASGRVEELHESVSWLPDAIMVLDAGMHLNWANATAQEWFGINLSRHIHTDFCSIINDSKMSEFIASRNLDDPYDAPAPALPEITIRLRILPYKNDQHLLQARDITRIKALEKVRRDFVANASHELSTPVSVLYGYLEMMLQDKKNGIAEEWKRAIRQMHGQTAQIKRIVEDMMILSRLEDPEITEEHETFELGSLIESVYENARVLSGNKAHDIRTSTDRAFHLTGNRKEVESLILNLVSNAVRYTPERGRITISWKATPTGGRLSVQDTGIGIEKEEIPRLTERFYRTDTARSRATGGTGLGLAIVNHIVIRHQATLHIKSKPGKGSKFSVIFPPGRVMPSKPQTSLVLG